MGLVENDIEDLIFNKFNEPNGIEYLDNLGLSVSGDKVFRQVRLNNWKIADLVFIKSTDRHIHVDVFELKLGRIDFAALHQVDGYVAIIEASLMKMVEDGGIDTYSISTVLIGSCVSRLVYLSAMKSKHNPRVFIYTCRNEKIEFHLDPKLFLNQSNRLISDVFIGMINEVKSEKGNA